MSTLALILAAATSAFNPDLFAMLDSNADGVVEVSELSDSQKPAFQRALRVADFDEDGKLTANELQTALKPSMPVNVSRGNDRQFDIARLDRNRDGKLTKNEIPGPLQERFQQLFTVYGQEIPIQLLKDRFQGSTPSKKNETEETDSEMKSMTARQMMEKRMQQGPQANKAENARPAMALLKRLDRNNDGRITRSEVPALMWNRLKSLDRNSDQTIDRQEFFQSRSSRPQSPTRK